MRKNVFITGIGTGVGKTLTSAIFAKALGLAYWKPIQCGDLENSDASTVKKLFPDVSIIPSRWMLTAPISPLASAMLQNVQIRLDDFSTPIGAVIEGAGGVLVPLNEKDFVIDLCQRFEASVVIVSQHYLGSINHTLLTIAEIKRRRIDILGLVFNGEPNQGSKDIILSHHQIPVLLDIPREEKVDSRVVESYVKTLVKNLHELQ